MSGPLPAERARGCDAGRNPDDFPGGTGVNLEDGVFSQFLVQLTGVAVTAGWSLLATFVMVKVIALTIGLRVTQDDEIEGLDFTAHGEKAYNP